MSAQDRPLPQEPDVVSRRRYERAVRAREEAEALLEEKSRALWEANERLRHQAEQLEHDISLRVAELERAKRDAEAASSAKSAFLAVMSHEIRTPMNAILGMTTGLKESGLTTEQDEMADIVLSSGRILLDLLNDMLDISKIEAGKMEIEERRFDLAALCDELTVLFGDAVSAKGLTLRVVREMSQDRMVVTDPTRLRQVLVNLVSNAIKFTEDGGIHIRVQQEEKWLGIEVRDTGPGVPAAQVPRLFRSFTQANASITRTHGGTGLGLVISRRLCRLMGGDLVYEDAKGGGALFRAWVRLKDAPTADRRQRRSETFDPTDVLTSRRWRILAAEDSLTNQKVLRLILKPFELDLELVGNGAQAVVRQREERFDLILMDVNMPVLDGLSAAVEIRADEAAQGLPRVPIIALTANAMTHQVADYLKQGIDAHVSKPVRRNVLAEEMARWLMRKPR